MKLLNIGCGSVRPKDECWTNLDNLRSQLKPGTPERINLDAEPNYVDHDLCGDMVLPFLSYTFDGILCSHVIEHFDCQQSVDLLRECRRILRPGGVIVVSVPDAEYFLEVHDRDTPDNAVELFGEPICPDEPWHKSFFDYALFYHQHKQVLTRDSLTAILVRSGFHRGDISMMYNGFNRIITSIMNRRKFSLEMVAFKSS